MTWIATFVIDIFATHVILFWAPGLAAEACLKQTGTYFKSTRLGNIDLIPRNRILDFVWATTLGHENSLSHGILPPPSWAILLPIQTKQPVYPTIVWRVPQAIMHQTYCQEKPTKTSLLTFPMRMIFCEFFSTTISTWIKSLAVGLVL